MTPQASSSLEPQAPVNIPFKFWTSLILQEATGLRAATLPQLAQLLKDVPEGCIYHHTHFFLLAHQYLTPEPTNDFAYWVTEILGEEPLGEQLASIDTMQYTSLESLREALVQVIDGYLERHSLARFKFASEGEEFFFTKSIHIVMPTPYVAQSLEEFAELLQRVSLQSLYFHIFDARLRLSRPTNDFSVWLDLQGESELAAQVAALDPYSHTLDSLRTMMTVMIRDKVMPNGRDLS